MLPKDYNRHPSIVNPDVDIAGLQYERNPEAEYGEHIKDTYAICNTSASHTYGNVLSLIEKYLLDKLSPQIEFKTVMANTTVANRQVRHLPHQLYKKELPMMALVPRISFGQDDNRFLGHTIMNDRYTDTHSLWGDGSLIPLSEDRNNGIWIHGHYNRALMFVDIIMGFDTYIEQVNALSYLHNVVGINHNKFVRAPLELYIPGELCELIGNLTHIPVRSENGSVYNFLTHMNTVWHHPITYKLKGGSNTDEFFMYYIADLDVVIQDVNNDTGVKDGQIRRNFNITFTVRCEFNTIGYFMLTSPQIKLPVQLPVHENDKILPIFSDSINLDDFILPIGWKILSWPIFKLKPNESSISIEPLLNISLESVIDHHLQFGIPMEKFISIQFRENGNILTSENFYIDWKKRMLHIANPNPRRTYRLIISVCIDYINNLVKTLYNLE